MNSGCLVCSAADPFQVSADTTSDAVPELTANMVPDGKLGAAYPSVLDDSDDMTPTTERGNASPDRIPITKHNTSPQYTGWCATDWGTGGHTCGSTSLAINSKWSRSVISTRRR